MTRFMATTAMATALLAGPTFAQTAATDMFRAQSDVQEIHASEFIGKRIYASEAEIEGEVDALGDGWEDVGEINDIILGRDGAVEAVLVDLGGFLGIGERQVALNMSQISFVSDGGTADDENDYFLVIPASRAMLEEAPEYTWDNAAVEMEEAADDVASATSEAAGDAAVAVENAGDQVAAAADAAADDAEATMEKAGEEVAEAANDAAVATEEAAEDVAEATDMENTDADRTGYIAAAAGDLTAEDLTGARVYDGNNKWIGEIDELLLTDDGEMSAAIVDVGGFMGLGEKPVEVAMEKLELLREDGGSNVLVYLSLTEEELEAMPTYEK